MSDHSPSIRRRLGWAWIYALIALVSGVLAIRLAGFPLVDVWPPRYGFNEVTTWSLGYLILRSPIIALEVIVLVYLYRQAYSSWRLWGLGVAFPVLSELVYHYYFGGEWVAEAWAWLRLWRDPPDALLDLDLVFRNAFCELAPPLLAGAFVTWLARRQAVRELSTLPPSSPSQPESEVQGT